MNKDRYPHLGPRRLVADMETALVEVRKVWPSAGMEGSTGAERTFFVRTANGLGLVAHCWPRKFREEEMYLRCMPETGEPEL